jgi:hypothetical protein
MGATLLMIFALVGGVFGGLQVGLRLLAGPNAEARDLAAKCYQQFRECENGDIDVTRFQELFDELQTFEHRTRFRTRRWVNELMHWNEIVWFTSPLRVQADAGYTRTDKEQAEVHARRWAGSLAGEEAANELIHWTGLLDRWIVGG